MRLDGGYVRYISPYIIIIIIITCAAILPYFQRDQTEARRGIV